MCRSCAKNGLDPEVCKSKAQWRAETNRALKVFFGLELRPRTKYALCSVSGWFSGIEKPDPLSASQLSSYFDEGTEQCQIYPLQRRSFGIC
jgi:hypothetical protein